MRKLCILLLSIMLSAPLAAIGFGYHVFEVRTEPEFSNGVFPTSVMYQFNFPMPDFISGRSTILAFRLDNGLAYRNLRQSPCDGSILARDPVPYPTEYTVLFDEFNLFFAQGFMETRDEKKDLLTAFISIDGRFENAYERLSWLSGPGDMEGLFNTFDGGTKAERFPGASWVGAPELAGSRSMFQTYISFGLNVDYMDDDVTTRDGIKGSTYVRLSPEWMILTDGTGSFVLWETEIHGAYTLFEKPMVSKKAFTWFSLVLDDKLTYRYLHGDRIPQYIMGGELWGPDVPASSSAITNRLSLSLYGPQLGKDTYPSITIFWDFGLGLGRMLNSSSSMRIAETVASYGIRAEFVIAGIAEFYYEIGCSYDPVFNEDTYVEQRFGFSIGV